MGQNSWKVPTVINQGKTKENTKKSEENKPNPVKTQKKTLFTIKLE